MWSEEPPDHGTTSSRSSSIVAGPIPGYRVELLDRTERAVRGSVVENLLRRDRADAGERVQLLECRRAQADGPGGAPVQRPPAAVTRARDLARHEHLLPVCERRSEIQRFEERFRRGPARPLERISDA